MHDPLASTISLDAIEREIALGTRRLAFEPAIEAVFQRATLTDRLHVIKWTSLIAGVLYDLFLISDWVTLNDMFSTMVLARVGIFTPVIMAIVFFAGRIRTPAMLELTGALAGILGLSLPTFIMAFSQSEHRLSYQYGSLLIMLFATVVQRLRFRFALVTLAAMTAIQIVATGLSGAFDGRTYVTIIMFFLVASALLATSAYYLEHAERRSFLFSLRAGKLQDRMEALAATDGLTGLFNRRHLDRVAREITLASETEPRTLSVILLDIDHFKIYNDSRGHLEGDACLRRVSACVDEAARACGAQAFRFGGEEILVLLDGAEVIAAHRTADAIRVAIEDAGIPHPALGSDQVVTASLGVASARLPVDTVDGAIAAADIALYAAKRAGRNRVFPVGIPPRHVFKVVAATAA